jgi:type II secretory pathway pseudopilin PulG
MLPNGGRLTSPPGSDEAGFTLVGAMIAVLVVNIALGVAVTSWVTVDRRAKEAELIWRGQQIVRAIACYGQLDAGEPLERLEQLVEASCLRRVYGDPMVRGGEWRILRQQDVADGTVAALLGQPLVGEEGPAIGPQQVPGSGMNGPAGASIRSQLQLGGQRSGQGGMPSGFGGTSGLGLRLSATTGGGQAIVGVVSTSDREGLRQYNARRKYSEWAFVAQAGPGQ